jgi:two-component system sensor histidine kinase QseC
MIKSLKIRLLILLLVPLTGAWFVTLISGYYFTAKTINRELDAELAHVAQSLSQITVTQETTEVTHATVSVDNGHEEKIEFQIWHNEKLIGTSPEAPQQSLSQDEGYSQNEVDHKNWRVFSTENPNSRVIVGADMKARSALIREMLMSSLWPMIVALPLIAIILWLSLSLGLKSLSHLANAIRRRTPEQLNPIDIGQIPNEVAPIVQSLNDLLLLVKKAIVREQEFSDNAAHELRTPLAAIKTHAQVALRSNDPQEIKESISAIDHGTDRATYRINQLLTLARLEPELIPISSERVDLVEVVSTVIQKLTLPALAKKIDLGFLRPDSAIIAGNFEYLEILVTNLVENAIRYTPEGGIINISTRTDGPISSIMIEDSGSGIPEHERERVLNRFVRLSGHSSNGSGIGLAIVKRIVDLHHAEIRFGQSEMLRGLSVSIEFKRNAHPNFVA